jgi:hypothetical protein
VGQDLLEALEIAVDADAYPEKDDRPAADASGRAES